MDVNMFSTELYDLICDAKAKKYTCYRVKIDALPDDVDDVEEGVLNVMDRLSAHVSEFRLSACDLLATYCNFRCDGIDMRFYVSSDSDDSLWMCINFPCDCVKLSHPPRRQQ